MPSCVVSGCSSVHYRGCGKSFHRFPFSRPELLKVWISTLQRENWQPSRKSVICSDHFIESCFDRTGQTVRLKSDAVPHMNIQTTLITNSCNMAVEPMQEPVNNNQDYSTSGQEALKRKLDEALSKVEGMRKKLKTSKQKSCRLKKKVRSLNDVVKSLTKNKLISEQCASLSQEK